jgi:hypothetical protein
MAEYACPACGAPIPFRSSFSVYAVCSFCGSTVLRTDRDVSLIGKQADLPEEISPLQVGTSFVRQDRYELLGRVRMSWADGAWTEWFVSGRGGKGWLAEAQGFLALSFEAPVTHDLAGSLPPLGAVVEIGGQPFRVSDIKQATCLGAEGELPFAAPKGRTATYYDMVSPSWGFAGLEESPEGRRLYLGEYVDFDTLQFSNLRPVEGWRLPLTPTQGDPHLPGR